MIILTYRREVSSFYSCSLINTGYEESKMTDKKPLIFLIIRYTLAWLLLCLLLTDVIGENLFLGEAENFDLSIPMELSEYVEDIKEKLNTKPYSKLTDKTEMDYYLQRLNAFAVSFFGGSADKVRTAAYFSGNEDSFTEIYGYDKAYLVINGEDNEEETILSCPINYLDKVLEATLNKKKNPRTGWIGYEGAYVYDEDKEQLRWEFEFDGWVINLLDGYVKGNEFRPGKVKVKYYEVGLSAREELEITKDNVSDEQIIDCSEGVSLNGFEYVSEFASNRIVFPEDTDSWEKAVFVELEREEVPDDLPDWAWYITYSFHSSDMDYISEIKLVENEFEIFDTKVCVPLSFLKGDIRYIYGEIITDANGKEYEIGLICYAHGGLAYFRSEFFGYMLRYYIILFVIMGVLAWFSYRRLYSLGAKNGLYKSLINSMAHDLKSPLMVMQGFCENLAENVHEEKKEYYAEQVLDNANYLNELMEKNVNLSMKNENDEVGDGHSYLSELVDKAEKRYEERLLEKNLKISKTGETAFDVEPDLMSLIIDNLITNAIKYSIEGETIDVIGKDSSFIIRNKAELTYNRSLRHLLEPLEMADSSRTAGKGTGLGLSIANGIVSERGWRMKLSYDKKKKIFAVKVILRRFL